MTGRKFIIQLLVTPAVAICFFMLSCNHQNKTLFTSLSSSETGIEFANILPEKEQLNILYHINYYNGGGVALGDINNDGLTDIYFTSNSKGSNKLYLNKGDMKFEDITAAAGVAGTADWCGGVTMADVNADGWLDIYVSAVSGKLGLQGRNELFINNRNNTFSENAAAYGLNIRSFAQQSAFFDYDKDGDLDCYILNQSEHPFSFIVDTSYRHRYDSNSGDRLMRNDLNKGGRFTDVSKESGIWQSKLGFGLGLAIADLNNDGWDDIYISNDFHENDYYYVNNGNGTFSDRGYQHFRHFSRFSMGNDVADYNNDGHPDVITVDMLPKEEKILKTYGSDEQFDIYRQKISLNGFHAQYSKNCLQQNNGNGISFSEKSLISGVSATDWSWAPLFADLDNDGLKDLMITSGIPKRPVDLDYVRFISDAAVKRRMDASSVLDKEALDKIPDGASHTFFFKGNTDGNFSDKSLEWGTENLKGYFTGAGYADLDNDGDMDVVINAINDKAVVFRNNTENKNYLTVKLNGDSLNRSGIGTKIYLFNKSGLQYQQLMLTRGFQSSSEPRLHFGLDSLKTIDSLLVVWPDQQYQVMRQVTANQQLVIDKKNAGGKFDHTSFFPTEKSLLKNISDQITCNWQHRENEFIDFNVQYLIPHKESTRGPKITVADINKDGLDDFYACGAAGQPGTLMTQTSNGSFIPVDQSLFGKATAFEDVDAVFFDANNDGWPDLYVVSGGNERNDGDSILADRFYLNDGKGHFKDASAMIPLPAVNKSCVAVADFDKDGDMDLFVGGFAGNRTYGIAQPSYLLVNDGKANFKMADTTIINLLHTGMVTAASFSDINNDSWPDLIVTGEWMPVKIYLNKNGLFSATEIGGSSGIWQSILTTDVNGDGFTDILAGNWGHNTKLWAGKNGPCKLYVKDFDKNGSVEQIMCYTIDGNEYPFLAKDELERPLPLLKKEYLFYSEVAGKTVQYIFYNLFEGYTELQAEVLSSSVFINDGKGNFKRYSLSDDLQLAPVFSFAALPGMESKTFLAGGNFYGVIPYEGRYDALQPTVFSFRNNTHESIITSKLADVEGEIRDIKSIRHASGKNIIVVTRNNEKLLFFEQQ